MSAGRFSCRPATREDMLAGRRAISALLGALGFDAMSRDVLTEEDGERLNRYARRVVASAPRDRQDAIRARLRFLGYRV